jgi:hypothetical protein
MSPLSPAAQAAWDAWNDAYEAQGPLEDMGQPIAAALRAAVDQVVPEGRFGPPENVAAAQREITRCQLLAIAAELDGTTAPTES